MNHHVLPCFAIHERFQDLFTETVSYCVPSRILYGGSNSLVPSTALEIARSALFPSCVVRNTIIFSNPIFVQWFSVITFDLPGNRHWSATAGNQLLEGTVPETLPVNLTVLLEECDVSLVFRYWPFRWIYTTPLTGATKVTEVLRYASSKKARMWNTNQRNSSVMVENKW